MSREKGLRYKTPEWLSKRGCAYDRVEQPVSEPYPVDIWIDPTPLLSWLFRISPGQPAFFVWAEFAARSSAVYVADVLFELRHAGDICFELLPCPGPKGQPYCFPRGEFPIPQEQVVNGSFPGTLYRHHPVKGYLMGVSLHPLPASLFGLVAAELSAVDEFGKVVGSTHFNIPLDPNEHGKRYNSGKGKGLYEPLDDDEDAIGADLRLQRKPLVVPKTVPLVSATKTHVSQVRVVVEKSSPGNDH